MVAFISETAFSKWFMRFSEVYAVYAVYAVYGGLCGLVSPCNVRLQKLQYICEELLEQNLIKLAYSVMLTFMFGRYTFVMRMYSCKRWRARRQQYSQGKKKELYPKYLAHKKRNLEAFCPG